MSSIQLVSSTIQELMQDKSLNLSSLPKTQNMFYSRSMSAEPQVHRMKTIHDVPPYEVDNRTLVRKMQEEAWKQK